MAPNITTKPVSMPSKAYVTFLAGNEDHVKGVVGLAKSLREVKAKYPLVVAILPDVPEDHREILVSQGCIVREIEPVYPPENQTQFAMAYYVINYSKLRIWEFVEYSKMIYLDRDIQVFENIDHLFDLPDNHFYAVFAKDEEHKKKIMAKNALKMKNQISNCMGKNRTCPKKHELKLDNNPNSKRYICNGCKEYGSNGMRYRCGDCNYTLHKDCMFSKPITTHEIFKDFIFKFCNACGKHVKGFIYHCPEKDLDLHPCCLNLMKEFQIDHVKFHLRETKSKCIFCNQIDLSGIEVWSYVSECGEYNVHVSCIRELIVEELENGTTDILALKNLGLPIQRRLKRNSGMGKMCLKILKIFLKTIISILLGDPTTFISLLVDLANN